MQEREIKAGYENLANAIIRQAIDDWTAAKIVQGNHPGHTDADRRIREVERFIKSEHYRIITNVSSDVLLKLMNERFERIMKRRDKYRRDRNYKKNKEG